MAVNTYELFLDLYKILFAQDDEERIVSLNSLIEALAPEYRGDLDLDTDLKTRLQQVLDFYATKPSPIQTFSMESMAGFNSEVVSLKEATKAVMLGDPLERSTYLAGLISRRLAPYGISLSALDKTYDYKTLLGTLDEIAKKLPVNLTTGLGDSTLSLSAALSATKQLNQDTLVGAKESVDTTPCVVYAPKLEALARFEEALSKSVDVLVKGAEHVTPTWMKVLEGLEHQYYSGSTLTPPELSAEVSFVSIPFPTSEQRSLTQVEKVRYGQCYALVFEGLERAMAPWAGLFAIVNNVRTLVELVQLEGTETPEFTEWADQFASVYATMVEQDKALANATRAAVESWREGFWRLV